MRGLSKQRARPTHEEKELGNVDGIIYSRGFQVVGQGSRWWPGTKRLVTVCARASQSLHLSLDTTAAGGEKQKAKPIVLFLPFTQIVSNISHCDSPDPPPPSRGHRYERATPVQNMYIGGRRGDAGHNFSNDDEILVEDTPFFPLDAIFNPSLRTIPVLHCITCYRDIYLRRLADGKRCRPSPGAYTAKSEPGE